jgi:hypothetical protein
MLQIEYYISMRNISLMMRYTSLLHYLCTAAAAEERCDTRKSLQLAVMAGECVVDVTPYRVLSCSGRRTSQGAIIVMKSAKRIASLIRFDPHVTRSNCRGRTHHESCLQGLNTSRDLLAGQRTPRELLAETEHIARAACKDRTHH